MRQLTSVRLKREAPGPQHRTCGAEYVNQGVMMQRHTKKVAAHAKATPDVCSGRDWKPSTDSAARGLGAGDFSASAAARLVAWAVVASAAEEFGLAAVRLPLLAPMADTRSARDTPADGSTPDGPTGFTTA
jgi:hypothetical protein